MPAAVADGGDISLRDAVDPVAVYAQRVQWPGAYRPSGSVMVPLFTLRDLPGSVFRSDTRVQYAEA